MVRINFLVGALAFLVVAAVPGGDGWWSVYFTVCAGNPVARGAPERGLVGLINGAADHVYGAFYQITSPRVAEALRRARARGVDVKIVTESETLRMKDSFADRFREAGIETVGDESRGLMHNKFAVVDGRMVWTGSYNPTTKGSGFHDENAILLQSPEIAAIYTDEFMEMFRGGVFGNRSEPGP
jgi:phosphatidylserine/phosphatidylglycerophosphate/cardiolipin synthase-like enzyme